MNEIINKSLLAKKKCMPEMYLKHPGFTYSAWGPFTTSKERIKKSRKHGTQDIIIKPNYIKIVFSMIYLMEI